MSLAASKNWRSEDGLWPHHETWMEWKRQEWHSERLSLEFIDILKTVRGLEHCLVESMTDAVSVSNGNLTLVVVIANK